MLLACGNHGRVSSKNRGAGKLRSWLGNWTLWRSGRRQDHHAVSDVSSLERDDDCPEAELNESGCSENGESQCAQAVKWLATSFLCMGGIGPRDLAPAARPRIGPQPDLVQWSLRVARSGRARTVSLSLCRWAQPGQFSQVTGTVANMETMDPTEAKDLEIPSPRQSIPMASTESDSSHL